MAATSASLLNGAWVSHCLWCCWNCWPGERRGADLRRVSLPTTEVKEWVSLRESLRDVSALCRSLWELRYLCPAPGGRTVIRAIIALTELPDGTCRIETARPQFLAHTAAASVSAITPSTPAIVQQGCHVPAFAGSWHNRLVMRYSYCFCGTPRSLLASPRSPLNGFATRRHPYCPAVWMSHLADSEVVTSTVTYNHMSRVRCEDTWWESMVGMEVALTEVAKQKK